MSVYSGFGTRTQEIRYNRNLAHLLQLMQALLLKFLKGERLDRVSWTNQFTRVVAMMRRQEDNKYMHPKFTVYCSELASYLGVAAPKFRDKSPQERLELGEWQISSIKTNTHFEVIKKHRSLGRIQRLARATELNREAYLRESPVYSKSPVYRQSPSRFRESLDGPSLFRDRLELPITKQRLKQKIRKFSQPHLKKQSSFLSKSK